MRQLVLCWLAILLLSVTAAAQTTLPGSTLPKPPAEAPRDLYGRTTPRGTLLGFLEAARRQDYRRAALFLHHRTNEGDAPELARELKVVLDRAWTGDPGQISDAPEGSTTDDLGADRESIGKITTATQSFPLLLERRTLEGVPVWQFAAATVNQVPEMFRSLDRPWAETNLPAPFLRVVAWDTAVWQWLGLLLLILIARLSAVVLERLIVAIARPFIERTNAKWDDELLTAAEAPLKLLLAIAVFRFGLAAIQPPVLVRFYLVRGMMFLAVIGLAWLMLRLIDVLAGHINAQMSTRQALAAQSLAPLVRRTLKVLAIICAFLFILRDWGYDTTALLAGLGVGGLAVALAAQKTIENLFGGLAIISDRPVLVGEFCKFGDKYMGTVEDIGLRSTRVRTLDRTVVTVPNGQFSSMVIENFGRRDKTRFAPTLQIRKDTTPDQLRYLLVELRKLLYAHPMVEPTPARVRFSAINQSSFDFEVFAFIRTNDWDTYLEVQEDLYLRMLDIVAAAGTTLAYPTQGNVIFQEPGIDPERAAKAADTVRQWRERHELQLPRFAPETIAELEATLDFPPKGSVMRDGATG